MIWHGHPGTHTGMLSYGWNKHYVAPLLLPDQSPSNQSPSGSEGHAATER
jgi:hypothetical protein